MKNLIIIALYLLPAVSFSQQAGKSVTYSIDSIRIDSFYLVERTEVKGDKRPAVITTNTFFRDTTALRLYVEGQQALAAQALSQAAYYKAEADSIDSRVKRIDALRKKVFKIKDAKREVTQPGDTLEAKAGFWVVYAVKGTRIEYVESIDQVQETATALKGDGTILEIKRPKKKKR